MEPMPLTSKHSSRNSPTEWYIMLITQGNPYTEEGRRANFAVLDVQGKGELDINDMRYINDQLKYGYDDDRIVDVIKTVGGFGAETVTVERYNRVIDKKIKSRKAQF